MEKGIYYTYLNTIIESLRGNTGRPVDLDSLHDNDNQFEQAINYIVGMGIITRTQNHNYIITPVGHKFLVDYGSFTAYDDEQSEINKLQKENLILSNKYQSWFMRYLFPVITAVIGAILGNLFGCV